MCQKVQNSNNDRNTISSANLGMCQILKYHNWVKENQNIIILGLLAIVLWICNEVYVYFQK